MIYCENVVKILWTWQLFFFYSFTDFVTPIFFFPFSAMPLPQLPKFDTTYFGNGIATIANFFFPTSFGFPSAHSHFEHPPGQQEWAEGIAAIPLPKIKNFSLSFSLQLLLNFSNGIAAIHSLSSDCLITWNSTYNTN